MEQRKTLQQWLSHKYTLIMRDDESLAEVRSLKLTYGRLIAYLGFLFLATMLISFVLVITVLSRQYNPHHQNLETQKQISALSSQLDSLRELTEKQDAYIESFRKAIDPTYKPASAVPSSLKEGQPLDSAKRQEILDGKITEVDQKFRKEFEEGDYRSLSVRNHTQNALQPLILFNPVEGVISKKFDLKEPHYGVDIVAEKNQTVKAIADGTVIMASWTQETGHVIGIQHKDELVSFYKHNAAIHYEIGDLVRAGDLIGIVGNSGEYTDGPHLHFELWYKGDPIDPMNFISI